jgi:NADPH:quinone reductase-like Zn-dependent oxidoreductase
MKAAIYERYGPPEVLELRDVAMPAPEDDEVLIKIHATTVTAGDWRARSLVVPAGFRLFSRLFFGISKPRRRVLGTELAGVIEAVGSNVRNFRAGDRVFAFPGAGYGSYAEYRCMPEDGPVAPMPPNCSFGEAAALSFGGTTALAFLRKAKLTHGERVLVNGASGGVGTAAVQLARHFGAEVTAVCSGGNAEMVTSLGAARVIDYTREDFTRNGEKYDVIVDTAGTAPYARSKHSLGKRGRLLLIVADLPAMLPMLWSSLTSGIRIIAGPMGGRAEEMRFIADLAREGKFRPFIDRTYPFERIVEAHRYMDTGRKRGNVVITVAEDR